MLKLENDQHGGALSQASSRIRQVPARRDVAEEGNETTVLLTLEPMKAAGHGEERQSLGLFASKFV
jgi:hypothetical protein